MEKNNPCLEETGLTKDGDEAEGIRVGYGAVPEAAGITGMKMNREFKILCLNHRGQENGHINLLVSLAVSPRGGGKVSLGLICLYRRRTEADAFTQMSLNTDETIVADRLLDACLESAEEFGIGAGRFQVFLEERVHLKETDFRTRSQVEERIADGEVRVHDGADDPGVLIKHLCITGEADCFCSAVPLGGDRLQIRFAMEDLGELTDRCQDDAHMGEVKEKFIRSTPELGVGNAGDGGIGNAMKELSGKPDRFDGFLFRFENMAMVVHDGTSGEIWH